MSPGNAYPLPGLGQQGVALRDMNGDGILDLVALSGNATPGTVTIRPGLGNGTFGAATDWSVAGDPREFVVVDVDGDSDLDIAVVGFGGQATILKNDGNADFSDSAQFAVPAFAFHISGGDLNGNGRPDLVTSQLGSTDVRIFFNNGDGTFQAGVNFSAGSTSRSTAIADLNGDGFQDIVAVLGASTMISVLLNNGDSTFAAPATFPTFPSGFGISLADLSGNGNIDAIVTSLNDSIAVLHGDGAGGFGAATILGAGSNPLEVLIADLDRDGIPDALTPNSTAADLSFFRGLGGGTFAPDSRIAAGAAPYGAAAADLTGNGALDLAVIHRTDSNVRIFNNLSPAPPAGISYENFQSDTTPADTSAFISVIPDSGTDSYVQINLTGGGSYNDTLLTLANDTGAGANYGHTVNLPTGDSVTIYIWTTQDTARILTALRLDTSILSGLPAGIPDNDTGRQAFGRTIFSLEFVDSAGTLLGDTISKIDILDTFVYTLVYHLTPQTASLYGDIGFDTATGSSGFRLWVADTYGAAWRATSHSVKVTQRSDSGLEVTVTGITQDLAGGLGGTPAIAPPGVVRGCVIMRAFPEMKFAEPFRKVRDAVLEFSLGRILVSLYYG